jgi:NADPH-dependent ferric siderophore reductase
MAGFQKLDTPTAQGPKGLAKVVLALFTKQATVTEAKALDERFTVITLQSPAFQGVRWVAGQKMQIMLGTSFVARTYTPMDWNPETGCTRLLAYAHGDSPAGQWLATLSAGDRVHVFGPRNSLDLAGIASPIVVLGDETSIGLAYAIQQQNPTLAVLCMLEVNAREHTQVVLTRLPVGTAELFERQPDEQHLQALEQNLPALVASGATFVLTGKASTIQRVRRVLKSLGTPAARMPTKAYWAPGKTGLD